MFLCMTALFFGCTNIANETLPPQISQSSNIEIAVSGEENDLGTQLKVSSSATEATDNSDETLRTQFELGVAYFDGTAANEYVSVSTLGFIPFWFSKYLSRKH